MTTAPKLIRELADEMDRLAQINIPIKPSCALRWADRLRTLAADPVGDSDGWPDDARIWLYEDPNDLDAGKSRLQFGMAIGAGAEMDVYYHRALPDSAEGEGLVNTCCGKTCGCVGYCRNNLELRATDKGKDAPIDLAGLERHRARKAEQPKAEGGFTRCDCDCPNGLKHIDIMHDDTCAALSAAPQPERAEGGCPVCDRTKEQLRSGAEIVTGHYPCPQPEQPARDGVVLERWGMPDHPRDDTLLIRRDDGYWTPWHIADEALRCAKTQPPQQADGGAVSEAMLDAGEEAVCIARNEFVPYEGDWNPHPDRIIAEAAYKAMSALAHPPKSPGVGVDEAMVDRVARAIYAARFGFSDEQAAERWQTVEQKFRFTYPAKNALGGEK